VLAESKDDLAGVDDRSLFASMALAALASVAAC
jgi:hypothetical protein